MIVITGGAGFIGSNLINELMRKNTYEIVSVDQNNEKNKNYFLNNNFKKILPVNLKKFLKNNNKKNISSKNYDFFELDSLTTKDDFIKLRAETDSEALKRRFSNIDIYNKNLPRKTSFKNLYEISEKIRYEIIGGKMLKGIQRNILDNYSLKIKIKKLKFLNLFLLLFCPHQ